MKKAIVFGASGFVGSNLLNELLSDEHYEQITIVVRKNLGIKHPKLKTIIGDYDSLPTLKEKNIEVDEIFITLGETKDYPVLAAEIFKGKGASSIFIITAVMADANSNSSYIRYKGEIERDIISLGFDHTHIFRPSMIMGKRKENRPVEKIIMLIWRIINPFFIGKMEKFKGIEAKNIAKAMINAAQIPYEKVKVYHWKEMIEIQ